MYLPALALPGWACASAAATELDATVAGPAAATPSAPTDDFRKRRRPEDSSMLSSPERRTPILSPRAAQGAHHDAGVALERPVRGGEVEHHHQAVTEVDEEVDVRRQPYEPGGESGELDLPDHRHRRFP